MCMGRTTELGNKYGKKVTEPKGGLANTQEQSRFQYLFMIMCGSRQKLSQDGRDVSGRSTWCGLIDTLAQSLSQWCWGQNPVPRSC